MKPSEVSWGVGVEPVLFEGFTRFEVLVPGGTVEIPEPLTVDRELVVEAATLNLGATVEAQQILLILSGGLDVSQDLDAFVTGQELILLKTPELRIETEGGVGKSGYKAARKSKWGDLWAYDDPRRLTETRTLEEAAELRAFLAPYLPQAMIPAAFIQLESVPLTPNGKVDRDALPEPRRGRPAIESPISYPAASAACRMDAASVIARSSRERRCSRSAASPSVRLSTTRSLGGAYCVCSTQTMSSRFAVRFHAMCRIESPARYSRMP